LAWEKGRSIAISPASASYFLLPWIGECESLCATIDASVEVITDPPERIATVVRSYLAFFKDTQNCAKLLIHERALFKDRKKPTYIEHREAHRERLRAVYQHYIDEGQIRVIPVDQLLDVLGDLLYGTMFTNYFSERRASVEEQAQGILNILFHGILSDEGRRRRPAE